MLRDERTAAAVYLLDDRWRRKTVACWPARRSNSPSRCCRRSITSRARLSLMPSCSSRRPIPNWPNASMPACRCWCSPISACCRASATTLIEPWVERGGVLLRFAGPRLAGGQDDLIPVTLREGDRSLGQRLELGRAAASAALPGPRSLRRPCPRSAGRVNAPGSGRARRRSAAQGLGVPRRRHAARHRQAPRQGLDHPRSCHRQCRLVESPLVWSVRRHAAADRRSRTGRRRRRGRRCGCQPSAAATFTPRRMLAGNGDLDRSLARFAARRRPARSTG